MKTPVPLVIDYPVPPDVLREEARIWLSRLVVAEVKQVDLQAFKRWQRTSPAHAEAFEEAKRQWQAMKPVLGELLRSEPKIAARHERMVNGQSLGRRAFLGAAVSVVAAAGIAVAYPPLGMWPSPDEWNAEYRTATGEQRDVALGERVSVILNTQTSIRRQVADGEIVGMELIAGEVAVDLVAARSAFAVVAGTGRSLADSGRFEVRRLEGKVCVTCIEGAVRVEHPAGVRMLQARQQTVYSASAVSGVTNIDVANVSAWRKGELVFRQTPLARVLDEINRYRPGRVVLMAKSRRESPVSGRFPIAVLDEALLQIERTFGLGARSFPGGLLVLS
ncbi:FecR domain-containing protein [Cupriavidus basilensis]|uniref:FecR domain-containing protein n=1 Tax=Cupriavidus basilensis TaxID=68895 RepID=A0ABT6AZ33_9BURK|nr:FecR domain-containing protein [Cupriavidus basilensis]MDF3837878.1 FecR domain-containing protein [Cupriavidus basilensis]